MILQKSFYYVDLLLKKHFLLLSMLKTVVLLNILVETMIFLDEQNVQMNSSVEWYTLYDTVYVLL